MNRIDFPHVSVGRQPQVRGQVWGAAPPRAEVSVALPVVMVGDFRFSVGRHRWARILLAWFTAELRRCPLLMSSDGPWTCLIAFTDFDSSLK